MPHWQRHRLRDLRMMAPSFYPLRRDFGLSLPKSMYRRKQTSSAASATTHLTPADFYLRGHPKGIVYSKSQYARVWRLIEAAVAAENKPPFRRTRIRGVRELSYATEQRRIPFSNFWKGFPIINRLQ